MRLHRLSLTAFGPFETIVALTGSFSTSSISGMRMPWLARFTTTRTMSPRPTSRARPRNCELLRSAPTSGVTTSRISLASVSMAMVRSS